MEMPVNYVVEMFIDRMCACKNYQGDNYTDKSPLEYYEKEKDYYVLHNNTRNFLELLLKKLANEGAEATIKYIKNEVL